VLPFTYYININIDRFHCFSRWHFSIHGNSFVVLYCQQKLCWCWVKVNASVVNLLLTKVTKSWLSHCAFHLLWTDSLFAICKILLVVCCFHVENLWCASRVKTESFGVWLFSYGQNDPLNISTVYGWNEPLDPLLCLSTSCNGDRTKWYWTKWHGQNGSNFYRFQFNLIEFVFSNHKTQISDKPEWV